MKYVTCRESRAKLNVCIECSKHATEHTANWANVASFVYQVVDDVGQGPDCWGREERHAEQGEVQEGHAEEPGQPCALAVQPVLFRVWSSLFHLFIDTSKCCTGAGRGLQVGARLGAWPESHARDLRGHDLYFTF